MTTQKQRVPPLNLTIEERRTLLHCIIAGEDNAVDHFGAEEQNRVNSIKRKLDYPVRDGESEEVIEE